MIKAAIFDMDGLLINSEPMWREAEIRILGERGVFITENDCRSTTGMRCDEAVKHWSLKFTDAKLNCNETVNAIDAEMLTMIADKGEALPGVFAAIEFFKSKNIPLAIASASSYVLINAVLNKLNIYNEFAVIQSAEHLNYGKPHPDVFLEAAKKLGVLPDECLVFEDSTYGVLAGKAAKMWVIAVPELENFNKMGFCIADAKLNSLTEFTEHIWDELNRE